MDPTEIPYIKEVVTLVLDWPHATAAILASLPILLLLRADWRRRVRARSESAASALPPEPAQPALERVAEAEAPAEDGGQAEAVQEPELEPELAPEPERQPEPVAAPAAEPVPAPAERIRLRDRLARTSEALVGRLGGILGGRTVDADLLEELEAALFTADLGVATAESLLETVKRQALGADGEKARGVLRDAILEKLQRVQSAGDPLETVGKPHVILVLGVNGSGKTTTIGKLAARYAAAGRRVVLGAGDTFRAAAIEQLQVWGRRVGCEVVAGRAGGDPASVAFDTVNRATSGDFDVAIIDTAGRLQTKRPLMEELAKISRVLGRDAPGAPHESLLVLDANTGQNAISQAKLFTEVAAVTGLVLTKLDGTAKGGVIVGLADECAIPVKYVGVGEAIEDLRDFDARDFVDALFEER